MTEKETCTWPNNDPLMIEYHDKEWGVPVHDDRKNFEFMVLDAFQAGLSWAIVLKKREGFRKAFENFKIEKIAKFDEDKIQELLMDANIIRNQQKIRATICYAYMQAAGMVNDHLVSCFRYKELNS